MPRKIDAGELLAALGALLVLVALFLEWFGRASGWEAFEALDLVLAMLALATLAAAASGLGADTPLGPRALLPLGLALLLVVAVQLVEPPPGAEEDDRGAGAWLALAGSALVVAGGVLRAARISVTVSVGGRDVRRRVAAVDRRDAAQPAAATAVPSAEPIGAPAPADPQATQPFRPVDPSQ